MLQDEALQLGEGRRISLKEEIENIESEAEKLKAELIEVKATQADKVEAAATREADLVKQREEVMESLQSQLTNLNTAIEERDATIASMKTDYEALGKELTASQELLATTEQEAKDLTCSVASLQARLGEIEQHNDSNMESNMMSQDMVKKMATTLQETKQLLNESVTANRGLLEQRDELTTAFKGQRDMLVVMEKGKKEAEEKVVDLKRSGLRSSDLAAVNTSR